MTKSIWSGAALLFALSLVSAPASAAQIGAGAFSTSAVSFGNVGASQNQTIVPQGFTIGPVSFTSTDALDWWSPNQNFQDCVGGCLTNVGADTLIATLTAPFNKVGLYVGQATAFSLSVSFYDAANTLLGSVIASGPGDGVSFAGWESSGPIARAEITKLTPNFFFVSAQSGFFENQSAVPEPSTWALLMASFGSLAFALRFSRRPSAATQPIRA